MSNSNFDLQALAIEAGAEVSKDLGADGVGLAQSGEGTPLTPALVAEMFPADGVETPYRLAGEK